MISIQFHVFILLFFSLILRSQTIEIEYFTKYKGNQFVSNLINCDNKESLYINHTKQIKKGTEFFDEQGKLTGEKIDYDEEFYKNFSEKMVYSPSGISYVKKQVLKEPLEYRWEINKANIKNILGYSCFEAKTSFKGRNYTAYFTEKIPMKDGPRKFSGLPGLILQLSEDGGMLDIVATKINYENISCKKTTLSIEKANDWETLLQIAKKMYYEKKAELEKSHDAKIKTNFSNNQEIYDLN